MDSTVWVCTVYDGNQTWPCRVFKNKWDAESWKARKEFEEGERMFPDQYEIEEFPIQE